MSRSLLAILVFIHAVCLAPGAFAEGIPSRGSGSGCHSGFSSRTVRIPGPDPLCRGSVGTMQYYYTPPRPIYTQPGATSPFFDTYRYTNHPVRAFNTVSNDRFQAGGVVRYPVITPGRFGTPGFGSRTTPYGNYSPSFGGHTRSFGYGAPIYGRSNLPCGSVGPYVIGWASSAWAESWVVSNPPPFAYDPLFYSEREVTIEQRRQFRDLASQRAGYLINQNMQLFDDGMALFNAGNYEQAAIKFLGAADADHGSAAARLHAGHALFALGRYDESVAQLSRAFELSPLLVSRDYDLRDEYGDRADFDRHLDALKAHVVRHPKDAAARAVLGYVLFRTDGSAAAYPVLRSAAQLDPRSFFVPKLLEVVGKTVPANGAERDPSTPARLKNGPASPRSTQGKLVKRVSTSGDR